jgi:hypothetical protein
MWGCFVYVLAVDASKETFSYLLSKEPLIKNRHPRRRSHAIAVADHDRRTALRLCHPNTREN